RVLAEGGARLRVRRRGLLVLTELLAEITNGLVELPDLDRGDLLDPVRGGERPLVELRRLRDRELRRGPVARDPRVDPRLPEALRREEVQREDLGVVLELRPVLPDDRVADARVELPAPAERETLVRRVAHQRVAETVRSVAVGDQELVEPAPRARV